MNKDQHSQQGFNSFINLRYDKLNPAIITTIISKYYDSIPLDHIIHFNQFSIIINIGIIIGYSYHFGDFQNIVVKDVRCFNSYLKSLWDLR